MAETGGLQLNNKSARSHMHVAAMRRDGSALQAQARAVCHAVAVASSPDGPGHVAAQLLQDQRRQRWPTRRVARRGGSSPISGCAAAISFVRDAAAPAAAGAAISLPNNSKSTKLVCGSKGGIELQGSTAQPCCSQPKSMQHVRDIPLRLLCSAAAGTWVDELLRG